MGQKRVQRDKIINPEMARTLCQLSSELNRQLGLLVHRSGQIESVVVGIFPYNAAAAWKCAGFRRQASGLETGAHPSWPARISAMRI